MTIKKLSLSLFLALAALATAVPAAFAAPEPLDLGFLGRTPAGGEATAEIAAFDPGSKRVFATDAENNQLDVFDFSDPTAPTTLFEIDLGPWGDGPNSVTFSPRYGGFVAVAVEAADVGVPGSVEVFDVDGKHLAGFAAGPLPDMVTTADHDHFLLVANEGEPADDGSVDPEGSVTVIDIRGGLKHAKVRTADFHGVPLQGPVRVFTPGSTVAQDLEPEYITSDGDRAWVSIQEANAIAVLDIKRARFEVVRGLGFKNHGLAGNGLDANDKDKAPTIKPHANLFGMYQPDALSAFTVRVRTPRGLRNETFIATANEGDARDYDFFAEESRVNGLTLDPSAFPAGTTADSALGRLTVTTTLGDANKDGKYEQLYAFGARSMSLLNADGQVVFDTGDQLEQLSDSLDDANYNKDNAPSAIDNRSDNKGPEPEAVATGVVDGRTYAFLGAERSGMIYAYDLSSNPGEAEFAGWINTRDGDLGPEGVEFVPAADSPTGKAMLLVTYEITGTVAAYSVTG
ncbi:MAG TPA: choice-of-anchor I family protein [Solirubrobacterales bacterium]